MIQSLPLIPMQDLDIDVGHNATVHVAAVGCLDLAIVVPIKAGLVMDRNTPAATILAQEATYDGYAAGVVTWEAPTSNRGGELIYPGTVPEFAPTGAVVGNMIGGLALCNAAKSKVYAVANIPGVGLPMNSTLNSFTAQVNWDPSTGGTITVIN